MSHPTGTHVTRQQDYLAGMSNLAYTGLSENWLLKECGHQHWLALAALYDRPLPDFADTQGRPAYAAFTAVRLSAPRLSEIAENQSFCIDSSLGRAGQVRHYSEHRLLANGQVLGQLEMLSTFVSRHTPGDNRSVTRASLGRLTASPTPAPAEHLCELQAQGKRLRSGDWSRHGDLTRSACAAAREYRITPCPDIDFNGADFLYFANFQAMVERAEWALLEPPQPGCIARRELHFHGNLNLGDSLLVRLHAASPDSHWCELLRTSDGRKLADVFTHKRYSRSGVQR